MEESYKYSEITLFEVVVHRAAAAGCLSDVALRW